MNEKRLKEIKDSMPRQLYSIENVHLDGKIIGEKWELYNEVIRLQEKEERILNVNEQLVKECQEFETTIYKAINFIDIYIERVKDYDINMLVVKDILKGDKE